MTQEILLYTENQPSAKREIVSYGGQIIHKFSPDIFVARMPEELDMSQLQNCTSSPSPGKEPSMTEKMLIDAWQQKLEIGNQAPLVTEGIAWDADDYQAPGFDDDAVAEGAVAEGEEHIHESTGTPTSLYMTGSVAVGVVIVSGDSGNLVISQAEATKIVAEVQEGLNFLANAEPRANISFDYDIQFLTVSATPGSNCSTYEACEGPWRNAALQQMGFSGNRQGSIQYVNQLRSQKNTDWAYVAYFTKYPLKHFAYAGQERLVMHYNNDGWGSDNINKVFAHETCHIFGAADEYGSCTCSRLSGYLQIPNNNCVNCSGTQETCLMNKNSLQICEWSRKQIGWDDRLFPAIINAIVKWANGKIYFFKEDEYIRYTQGQGVDAGYPKKIAGPWRNWPTHFTEGVDAGVLWPNGKAYFFKGDEYIRYVPGKGVDPGYPRKIAGPWRNWPHHFTEGIDAGVLWPDGKAYFFKGDEYIRYAPGKGADAGYPKKIAGSWINWPENFTQGIDAALLGTDGKAYFFKNNQVIRYSPGQGVDAGYPKPITEEWAGLAF